MSQSDVEVLRGRVQKGIEWLEAHDPTGAFHLWYKMGLSARSPMPAQPAERIAEWREYHRQRERWTSMRRDLARLEARK